MSKRDKPPKPNHEDHEHPHHPHDHDHHHEHENPMVDVFLALREQNLELLKVAIKVAGSGKAEDKSASLERIWEIYSEFYEWIDPEATADEDDDGE